MAGAIVPGSPRPLHCLLHADQTASSTPGRRAACAAPAATTSSSRDALVPAARDVLACDHPDRAFFGPLAAGTPRSASGIARAAIFDGFVAIARRSRCRAGKKPIAVAQLVQVEVAKRRGTGWARARVLPRAGRQWPSRSERAPAPRRAHAVEARRRRVQRDVPRGRRRRVYTRSPRYSATTPR